MPEWWEVGTEGGLEIHLCNSPLISTVPVLFHSSLPLVRSIIIRPFFRCRFFLSCRLDFDVVFFLLLSFVSALLSFVFSLFYFILFHLVVFHLVAFLLFILSCICFSSCYFFLFLTIVSFCRFLRECLFFLFFFYVFYIFIRVEGLLLLCVYLLY